ncbi:MAG: hypothetical protein Q9209_001639 [Squamulea sp. 1 TL-2023]
MAVELIQQTLKDRRGVVPRAQARGCQANLGANVPAAFKVELTHDPTLPIPAEEIFRPALKMMYRVTGLPLSQLWYDDNWPSPLGPSAIYVKHNTFGKEPSRLRSQYLIWGMNHLLISMQLTNRYCQTVAVLKWEGNTVGSIHVLKSPPPGSIRSGRNTSDIVDFGPGGPKAQLGSGIDMNMYYGERAVDKNLLYLTCIKAMGEAAEAGLQRMVAGLYTLGLQQTAWKLLGDKRQIEAGFSREAAVLAVGRMIHDNKWCEVYVWVKIRETVVAVGGYTQGFQKSL